MKFSDLDDRAIEALKELDDNGALAVLKQFNDSNLQVRMFILILQHSYYSIKKTTIWISLVQKH